MMKSIIAKYAFCLVLAAGILPASQARTVSEKTEGKKVLGLCWGFSAASPSVCLKHADRFADAGFDGQLMQVLTWKGGKRLEMHFNIWDTEWRYDDYRQEIPVLKKLTAHRAFRETFLSSLTAPSKRRIDWNGDDEIWSRTAANLRTAARIAREGGCRGLWMDTEDYRKKLQFKRVPGEMPLDELRRTVRTRAAQLFKGAFEEYPDMTLFSLWFLSLSPNWYASPYGDRDEHAIADGESDLWPAFVNGILDVLPESAWLVDGNENYWCDADKNSFCRDRLWIKRGLRELVAPENKAKYDRQMQVSTGLYLDMYVNGTNTVWRFPEKDGSRLETFHRNYVQAIDAVDEYVWLYGEKLQFIKWDNSYPLQSGCVRTTWDEALNGIDDIVCAGKDADGFIRKRIAELKAAGKWRNLVANGACEADDPGVVPKPFSVWQPPLKDGDAAKKGVFGVDSGFGDGDKSSLCAEGAAEGCFLVNVKDVTPGDYYLVKVSAAGVGIRTVVSWRDKAGKYTGRNFHLSFSPSEGMWRKGRLLVRAPMKAARMTLTMNVELAEGEKAWFDNVEVYRMSLNK